MSAGTEGITRKDMEELKEILLSQRLKLSRPSGNLPEFSLDYKKEKENKLMLSRLNKQHTYHNLTGR